MSRYLLLAATLLATSAASLGQAGAQPVAGLYVAGAGGANFLQTERIESVRGAGLLFTSRERLAFDAGVVGLGSLGYGFGNGLRIELEGNYRNNRFSPDNGAGLASFGGREQKYGGMFNILFDLDVGSRYVFPYIGGGAGYAQVDQRYTATSVAGGVTSRAIIRGEEGSFAYQAMAGLSFPVPPVVGLSLTAEYRFYALAGERDFGAAVSGTNVPVTVRTSDNFNHGLMLGLRYAFNTVRPPAPEVPVVARPAPEASRSYLVFFDWDRADLTDRARQIINEAAQSTTRVAVTRIEVAGHADKSGTDRYNQGLSQRRAQNVASELVRLGVPRAAITTQAFGENRPLVQTADGVREPQNRRVEIVLK